MAAGRRGVRRVRHGQDVGQGELRTVSGGGAERRVVHRAQSDRRACRRRRRGRGPTRTATTWPTATCRTRPLRTCARPAEISAAPNASANFGTQVFESTLDPALLSGWGVRSGDWQWGASVQQEVLPACRGRSGIPAPVAGQLQRHRQPRAGARGSHRVRRQRFPSTRGCPDGGGGVLDGLYNVTPTAATRLNDNYQTLASNYRRVDAGRELVQPERHGADAQRPDAAGRVQHGNERATTTATCRRAIPEWTVRPCAVTDQPVVRHVVWMGHSRDGARLVHDSEGRRAGRPARCAAIRARQLAANWTAPNSATVGLEPAVCRPRRPDDHREPDRAGHALRRSRQRRSTCGSPRF